MPLSHLFLSEFVSDRGLTLRRWQTPLQGKPVLHFIHGNGFNGRVYSPMFESLLRDYDLVLSDAQGHGESDTGHQFLGWDENAELLSASLQDFCARNNVQSVLGVGHSFGGVMTSLMAATRPALFSRLVLLDPVLLPPLYAGSVRLLKPLGLMRHSPMVKQALKRRAVWRDRRQAEQYFTGRGMFRSWTQTSVSAYARYGLKEDREGVRLKTPPWLEAEIFSGYSTNIWPLIRKLNVPTDIVYGASTYPFIKQGLARARRLNPSLQLHEVQGGHCFMMSHPESTAKMIRNLGVQAI
ncbi:MAG: alpha/beta hydrolase [Pseudomonadales bacterium]|nr:alpha/beta hydrolase [Pseudomonadales bacterium]